MNSAVRDPGSGKPLRRLPRPRLLSLGFAAAGVAVIVAGFFLQGSTPVVDPSPPESYGPAAGPVERPGGSPLGSGLTASSPDGGLLPDASAVAAEALQPSTDPPPVVRVSSGLLEDLPTGGQPEPVRLVIPALGIDAPIRAVGVRNGEMEVPPTADLVAWYRFGPTPGDRGSAVLAAHVSWGGELGVFYRLRDLPQGAEIEVWFTDGSVRRFRSVALTVYDKADLPVERIFRRAGEPTLTLVTCGGAFNQSLRSFEQNIVAYAAPADDAPGGQPGSDRPS